MIFKASLWSSLMGITSVAVASAVLTPRNIQRRDYSPRVGFQNAEWIWTDEQTSEAPIGSRGFRTSFTPPETASCTTITIAADNEYVLYVNGIWVGETPPGFLVPPSTGWSKAQTYIVPTLPGTVNVVAINATNTGAQAGVIAEILTENTDGSGSFFWTSSEFFKTFAGPTPEGFELPSFDDSQWVPAVNFGEDGVAPWGFTAIPALTQVGFNESQWIWTNEETPGSSDPVAPVGSRVFRKTITSIPGKTAVCAKMIMAVDNTFNVYVNGESIGGQELENDSSGPTWETGLGLSALTLDPDSNLFAVSATNLGGSAGVIGIIELVYSDSSTEIIFTDSTWKAGVDNPPATEQPSFDDSQWSNAIELGLYGVSPWGDITVPSA